MTISSLLLISVSLIQCFGLKLPWLRLEGTKAFKMLAGFSIWDHCLPWLKLWKWLIWVGNDVGEVDCLAMVSEGAHTKWVRSNPPSLVMTPTCYYPQLCFQRCRVDPFLRVTIKVNESHGLRLFLLQNFVPSVVNFRLVVRCFPPISVREGSSILSQYLEFQCLWIACLVVVATRDSGLAVVNRSFRYLDRFG